MDWKPYNWKEHSAGRKGEVLNKAVYKCGFCRGKGHLPSRGNATCPVCSGNGTVNVDSPAVVCAYCREKGRSHSNRELPCSVCKGKGVVGIEGSDIRICPVCKGNGRETNSSLPCLACKGKGVIVQGRE